MTGVMRFRCFTAVVAMCAIGLAVSELVQGARVNVWVVLVFGCILVFAEHQDVSITEQTSFSAGLMVATAGVVAGADSGSAVLTGLAIGAFAGFEISQMRAREYSKMIFNGCVYALATAAAGWVIGVAGVAGAAWQLAVVGAVAAACFFTVNLLLVILSISIETREGLRPLLVGFLPDAWHVLPFGVLGVFLGRLYIDFGAAVVILFISPIFVARSAFASYTALRYQQESTLRTLIGALEAKDPYTAGHAERVARYAQFVGEDARFTPGRLERLRYAALMHDIGKLIVPNRLLNKRGRLTEEEFAIVQKHEDVTVELLRRIDFLAPVAPTVHGEAMQYVPDARDAPIEPFIIAATDAYDAMTSSRSYRKALPQEEAFEELRRNAGTQFHPDVVAVLIAAIEKRGERHGAGFEVDAVHADAPEAGTGSAGLGHLESDDAPAARESNG